MSDQDIKQFADALAELYVRRRREWWSAIDGTMSAMNLETQYLFRSIRIKDNAAAKWDQMVEVVELLPKEIKDLVLKEVERIQ